MLLLLFGANHQDRTVLCTKESEFFACVSNDINMQIFYKYQYCY
jgi:hypothetical protein